MTKKANVILLLSIIVISSIILINQNIVQSQELEAMPENITLKIGQSFVNRDEGIFFAFCGVESFFFGGGPNAVTVGHIMSVFGSDIFSSDQACNILFQEGDSIFFKDFEYDVTTLQSDLLFLVKQ